MNDITIADISLFNEQPTVLDLRIAEALGYVQPRDIRKIVKRNLAELSRYGEVCATMAQTSPTGGRPAEEFHLNEAQALLVCMKSDTERAADVRQMVIEVFMQWRRRSLAPAPDPDEIGAVDAPLMARVETVKTAMRLFGRERARMLWVKLGLPSVPPEPAHHGRAEALSCLRHLLDHTPNGATVRELIRRGFDDDMEAQAMLRLIGVRLSPDPDGEGFRVGSSVRALARIYGATEWATGRWTEIIRRLPGTRPGGVMRAGENTTRSTFVPSRYLDESLT